MSEIGIVSVEPKSRAITFSLRLDPASLDDIRELAGFQGIGPTQLVRLWVLERLDLEKEVGSLKAPTTDYPLDTERLIRRSVLQTVLKTTGQVTEDVVSEIFDQMDRDSSLKAEAMAGSFEE